jgi:hypothetical protein
VAETLEEAAVHQAGLWARQEAGESIPNIRYASLKKGYELRQVPEHGLGSYPINTATGKVCEGQMVWALDGQVLLCDECFEDGT